MTSILDLNSTMKTARTERVSWKSVGLTYLFYLVLMLLMQWGLSPFVKKGNLLVLLMVCAVVVILLLLFVFFYLKRSWLSAMAQAGSFHSAACCLFFWSILLREDWQSLSIRM